MRAFLTGGATPLQRLVPLWSVSHRLIIHPSSARLASNQATQSIDLPDRARVVICGGGIAGTSVAYHLGKLGWSDVLLLEQGSLTCGTTWHSVGLIGLLKGSAATSQLSRWSAELYENLKEETDIDTGYRVTGAVMIAQSQDRMTAFKRLQAREREIGSECHLLTPSEIEKLVPYIRTDDLVGGMYSPIDGRTDPTNTVMALAKAARRSGTNIVEGVQINKIRSENGCVSAIETSHGTVKCEYFVNCGGQWARDIGLISDPVVHVPLHTVKHQYMITKPFPGVEPQKYPYVRDYDIGNYMIDWGGGLLVGMFAKKGKPIFFDGIPEKTEFLSMPEDWDHFGPHMEGFLHRIPAGDIAEVQQLFNGPESFTPDGNPLFGPVPEMDNYFVMAGMSSQGVVLSGGLGRLMAEWIMKGYPSINTWNLDIRRFAEYHNNKTFLRDRVGEAEAKHYHNPYPWGPNFETGRMLRCSPLFGPQKQAGAVFAEKMGVERPVYFMNPADQKDFKELQKRTFGKPNHFDLVNEEYWACRESVCIMDMTSFSKFELESDGPEACALLQKLCPNEMDMPVGSVAHTAMLNERGGYENDCSVARVSENKYFIISPSQQLRRGFKWISKHMPSDGSVQLQDVTSYYTGINVLGPRARSVLQRLTSTSVSVVEDMEPFSIRDIRMGYAHFVRVMSVTHSGEDGYILYVPNEMAINVYSSLRDAGKAYGIRNVGYYALTWLRIEKLFAYWADDFNDTNTPYEIGKSHRVKFDKNMDFIGKSALLAQQKEGIRKRLTQFTLEDHDIDRHFWPAGGEPIYRNGEFTGLITSSGYGPSLGKIVCLGWVTNSDLVTPDYVTEAEYVVDVAGQRFRAKATLHPHKQASRHDLIG